MGLRSLTVTVEPGDTLESIKNKINNPNYPTTAILRPDGTASSGGNPLHYDPNGYPGVAVTAKIENGRLQLNSTSDKWLVTVGGSNTILSALGINYEYTTLSSVGIKLPSFGVMSDKGKSGELEFDTSKFMDAMRNNPDNVAMLFRTFSEEMQTYLDDMVRTSQKEVAPGVVTTYGAVAREMKYIDDEIIRIDKYLTDFERRLQNKQQGLFKQYAAAEVSMAKLLEQASWLASVTSQLQQASSR